MRDPGELRLLRRYERSRAEPILAVDTMVDSLFRTFGAPRAASRRALRNAGLNLTDRLPVLKNMLMRHAMMMLLRACCSLLPRAARNEAQIRACWSRSSAARRSRASSRRRFPGCGRCISAASAAGCRSIYTDATASYVIDGNIHELRTNRDLTERAAAQAERDQVRIAAARPGGEDPARQRQARAGDVLGSLLPGVPRVRAHAVARSTTSPSMSSCTR